MTYTCCHDQAHGRLKKLQSLPHHQQHRGTTSASAACRPDQRPHAAVPSGSLAQAGPLPHTNRAARRAASVSCAHHTVPPQATRQSFVLIPAEADQWRHGLVRTRTAPPTRWSGHVAGRTRHGMHCRRTTVRPDVRQYRCACGGVPQYLSVSARRRQQPRVGDSGHSPGAHALRDLCIYLTSMRNLRMLAA